jgi:SGNH domain (fused to AT3 domains)
MACGGAALLLAFTAIVSSAASGDTNAQVLVAVRAALSIKNLPSSLTPTLSEAVNDKLSPKIAGANDILNKCDPYWTHSQAAKPVPCLYGDLKSKKVVVIFGDSNAGNWTPAFDQIFKALGYKLDLFGFIGCTTAPVTETATSQPGFSDEWKLCNTWHKSLPAAVRAVRPVAIISASSPWSTLDATERADWVSAMKSAYSQMTIGLPRTVKIAMGTSPLYPQLVPYCLANNPNNVQQCAFNYSSPTSWYNTLLARDKKVAAAIKGTLIPSFQWFCKDFKCSPVIGKYLVCIDRDHTTTAYDLYLESALRATLLKDVKLP